MIAVTKVDNGLTTEEFTSVWYLPVKLVSIVGSYPPVIIILPSLASNKLLLLRSNADNSDGVNCKEKLPDASVMNRAIQIVQSIKSTNIGFSIK